MCVCVAHFFRHRKLTANAPENGWLEDEMSFWDGIFTFIPGSYYMPLFHGRGRRLFPFGARLPGRCEQFVSGRVSLLFV